MEAEEPTLVRDPVWQELVCGAREDLPAVGEDADAVGAVDELLAGRPHPWHLDRRPAAGAEQRAGRELDQPAQRAGADGDRASVPRPDRVPPVLLGERRRRSEAAAR